MLLIIKTVMRENKNAMSWKKMSIKREIVMLSTYIKNIHMASLEIGIFFLSKMENILNFRFFEMKKRIYNKITQINKKVF